MSFRWIKTGADKYFPLEKSQESSRSLTDGDSDGCLETTVDEGPKGSRNLRAHELVQLANCVLCICILLSIGWQNSWHISTSHSQYESKTLTCGHSTSEAKARGCDFDLLADN